MCREEDWTEKTAYATIKFTVPPSVSDKFEDAWCARTQPVLLLFFLALDFCPIKECVLLSVLEIETWIRSALPTQIRA